MVLAWDSAEYIEFASDLKSGDLFETRDLDALSYALVFRTPGYPLLILLGQTLTPNNLSGMLSLHAAFALLAIIVVSLGCRHYCPPLVLGLLVLISLHNLEKYFSVVLTEWVSLCLLLMIFGLLVVSLDRFSLKKWFFLGVLCAFLVIIRPALVVVLLLPFVLFFVQGSREQRSTGLFLVFLSLFPIFAWAGFNYSRLGVFTLSLGNRFASYAAFSVFFEPEIKKTDGEDFKYFVQLAKSVKRPNDSDERVEIRKAYEQGSKYDEYWQHNGGATVEAVQQATNWDLVKVSRLMQKYVFRSIRPNLGDYLVYVAQGARRLLHSFWMLPFALFLPLYWLRKQHNRGLAIATLAMVFLHFAYIVFCASIAFVLMRFYLLTYQVVLAASLISLATFLVELVQGKSVRDFLFRDTDRKAN